MKRTIPCLFAVFGIAVTAAACGDDSSGDGPAPSAASTNPAPTPSTTAATATPTPSTTDATTVASSTTLATPSPSDPSATLPSRIVSLSPTATEMLFAIGADDRVLAVDNLSNHPEAALAKQQGIDAFQPNVEAIAALEPDLVVTDGTNPDLLTQFDALQIPHWEGPAATTLKDIYAQIEQLGALTGHVGEAAEVVAQMSADIDRIVDELPELETPLTYYHELGTDLYSVTSDTFIGLVYSLVGLENIADGVDAGTAYPQLSAEYILLQDPDLIFLACTKYCGETPQSVAARDGWGDLTAVRNGGVIPMDDDIASRWGPRIVDYLEAVAAAVAQLAPVGG